MCVPGEDVHEVLSNNVCGDASLEARNIIDPKEPMAMEGGGWMGPSWWIVVFGGVQDTYSEDRATKDHLLMLWISSVSRYGSNSH